MELTVAISLSSIVLFGIGVVLVDNQRGWAGMYNRVNSDVVTDCYIARKTFDSVVRKSSIKLVQLGSSGQYVEVYYYQNPGANPPTDLDRYARFYTEDGLLKVDYGTVDEDTWTTIASQTVTLASNVNSALFSASGVSLQMALELDNGKEAMAITCSSMRHNE
jgi:hypothetical protein